jgi:hypothetical protein
MRRISTLVSLALSGVTLVAACGNRAQPLGDPSQGGTTAITSASRAERGRCSTGIMPNTSADRADCREACNKLNDRVPEGMQCMSERAACKTKCDAAFQKMP